MMRNIGFIWARLAVACLFLLSAAMPRVAASDKMAVIPKWDRFEQSFKSAVWYTNALQGATGIRRWHSARAVC